MVWRNKVVSLAAWSPPSRLRLGTQEGTLSPAKGSYGVTTHLAKLAILRVSESVTVSLLE
jgi:hypothetical protein